jgi:parallel beta-helix repeat protein
MPNHGSQDATLTITGSEKPIKVIPAGYTTGGTITAQLSAALADKIQAGETIGGVTGTLEMPLVSGNATAADILAGKTATTDNGLITGTMPNNGNQDAILTITGDAIPTIIIPDGYTTGGTVIAQLDSSLASSIKSGTTIGGVTGTLEVSGNATAEDLLAGKTATTDNGPITGTMPDNGNQDATLTITGDAIPTIIIPAGYTSGGTITAQLSADLADKIQAGETIGGVTGTLEVPSARVTIGTTQNGWTAGEVDYLCDGTDDQEEIIQALNDLPETGGEVVILDGTYNITASINIPKDNVSLRGNGNATTLRRMYNSTNTDSGPTARGLITLNEKSGCKIQGLQIDGNRATYTVSYNYGIYLYRSNNNTITDNTCTYNNNLGIYLSFSGNNTVTNNTCNDNSSTGIDLYSSSNNTVTNNTCTNNNTGIYLSSSSNSNTVTGNTCNDSDYGIFLIASSNNTIIGNTCNNNNETGIYLYGFSNSMVTGNTCTNNNRYGIFLDSFSNDNTITGNTCNNNSSSGIYLSSSSNNTVTNNTCTNNNNKYGIHLKSSESNTVTGNTCNDNVRGIYLYRSSNNTVTNNTCTNNSSSGIYLSSSSNNTITGNTCTRGTGTPEDYTTDQYTILLSGTGNNYNLISFNNCMGKAVVIEGGTDNSAWGNEFDDTDDLP